MTTLGEHIANWKDCQDCALAKQRRRICLGKGDIPCEVLFIGEAPGDSEDAVGEPFVGPAGGMLDVITRAALSGWPELRVAYTNLVCCFPRIAKSTGDNQPEPEEIRSCERRLIEFVNIARPRLIVCLGRLASEWIDHHDSIKVVDLIHPAAITRKPTRSQKEQDIRKATVILRGAVSSMLMDGYPGWREWTNGGHADTEKRLTVNYDWLLRGRSDAREDEIPF